MPTEGTASPPADVLDRLRLTRSDNVGPITYRKLVERFGSAAAALDALPDLARRGAGGRGKKRIRVCTQDAAEEELKATEAIGAVLLAAGEPGYPPLLARCEDAPPLISAMGHLHLLAKKSIAVVGARNASANGKRFARTISADLGNHGIMVVSGLARGIDAEAHEGALTTGTAAVVAGGVDVIYPKENERLYHAICEQGVIIAEGPPGLQPQARHFPRRNRLISGMARGVVVVEAAPRSGSLITARMALEQGRDVFAVPGSPMDPRARGTNDLIRQGAVVTESATDVMNFLNSTFQPPLQESEPSEFKGQNGNSADENEIEKGRNPVLENLSPSPLGIDELIRSVQLSPAVVSIILLELELAGRLERHPGNQVSLIA